MTRSLACLRRVEPARLALDATSRLLRRAGIETRWTQLDPAATYLRFAISDADTTHADSPGFHVEANQWVTHRLPALGGLAWGAMSDRDARALFGAIQGGPRFHAPVLAGLPLRFTGLLRQPSVRDMLAVDSGEGPVVFDAAPSLPIDTTANTVRTSWLGACAVPIDFRQGAIDLPARTLRRAAAGDVLLLTRHDGVACLGEHALFSFNRTTDTLSVDDIFNTDFLSPAPVAAGDTVTAPGLALDNLTVTVDVIVARMQTTLAELADLRPGSLFALGDAGDAVRLVLGGNTIATGELVQAGDRLGVLLHRIGKT